MIANRCSMRWMLVAVLPLLAGMSSAQTDDNLVKQALQDSTFKWSSLSSAGITVYYQQGSFAERHRMMLLRSMETTVGEVLTLLEEPRYDRPLSVFYLNSRDEMRRIVGRPNTGFSDWNADGIFLVVNPEWRSFEKHEFTHMVTMGLWGPPDPTSRWMVEGICVYCDGLCRQYTVDQVAAQLLSADELPPLRELFDDYARLGEIKAGFSAASFIGFVRSKFGMSALRALWSNGISQPEKLLGDDLGRIEKAWRQHVQHNAGKDSRVDLDAIKKLGCG